MILFRFILIGLIVYLVLRSFMKYSEAEGTSSGNRRQSEKVDKTPGKKVSKEIGEYIDYEEVDK